MSRVSTRWRGVRSEACEHGACYDCLLTGCDHSCHAEVERDRCVLKKVEP